MNHPPTTFEQLPAWAKERGNAAQREIELLHGQGHATSQCVYEDDYIAVFRDPVRFPDGHQGNYMRIFEKSSLQGGAVGVVILPFYQGSILLLRHYRHATRTWELELPRGFSESGGVMKEDVRRELMEELGVAPVEIQHIGQVNPNTGLLASTVDVCSAILSSPPVETADSIHEGISQVVPMTPSQLMNAIREGQICDGFTLAAVCLAQAHGILSFTP
jgi:ADP-ribose pyrophosphatase